MPFEVHICPILWWGDIEAWFATKPTKAESSHGDVNLKIKKEPQTFLGIINYLGKFFPSTADTSKPLRKLTSDKKEWTWNATYLKMFNEAKAIIKEEACMKFYDETNPLYIKRDASGVGLGATLLQTRNNTSCAKDEAPDNSILRHIPFASKSLDCNRKKIQQYRKRSTRHTIWAGTIPPLLFCKRGECNYRSQTTQSQYLKKMLQHFYMETASMNSTKITSIQSENHIPAWTRSIHSRLSIQTKPQLRQRCRNTGHAGRYQCNTDYYQSYQNVWQSISCNKWLAKINTCSVSRNISYKAGLTTKIKYNKIQDNIGHSGMTWQSLLGSSWKKGV